MANANSDAIICGYGWWTNNNASIIENKNESISLVQRKDPQFFHYPLFSFLFESQLSMIASLIYFVDCFCIFVQMSSNPLPTSPSKSASPKLQIQRSELPVVASEEIPVHPSSTSSPVATTPTLVPNRVETESQHEDDLIERMDELIRTFFSRPQRRSPYRSLFRWTFDDANDSNLSYSVVVKIEEPSPWIERKD